jgi:hypothetical protein
MSAMSEGCQQLDRRTLASNLSISAMGARGEWDEVKKMTREWSQ